MHGFFGMTRQGGPQAANGQIFSLIQIGTEKRAYGNLWDDSPIVGRDTLLARCLGCKWGIRRSIRGRRVIGRQWAGYSTLSYSTIVCCSAGVRLVFV